MIPLTLFVLGVAFAYVLGWYVTARGTRRHHQRMRRQGAQRALARAQSARGERP